jgi:uncharacterized membrane protein YfcA
MDVFLPIAEVSVNIIAIFALSGVVGILSGLFGVGVGFFVFVGEFCNSVFSILIFTNSMLIVKIFC